MRYCILNKNGEKELVFVDDIDGNKQPNYFMCEGKTSLQAVEKLQLILKGHIKRLPWYKKMFKFAPSIKSLIKEIKDYDNPRRYSFD